MNWDKNSVIIGSQLWVDESASDAEIESDVLGMLDNGLKIARIFIGWGAVEKARGQWDFSLWDQFFSICEKHGLMLTVTLTAASVNPWIAKQYQGQIPGEDQFAYAHERAMLYVDKTVARYKNYKCLHSWILWNEPTLVIEPDSQTIPQFRKWLPEHYNNDWEAIRKGYGNIDSIDGIGFVRPDGTAELPSVTTAGWLTNARPDWARFNQHLLEWKIKQIRERARAIDPEHPATVNPDATAESCPAKGGRSIFGMGEIVDFMGCSCHVSWHSTRFPADRIHQSVAMFSDMMRGATNDPDGYFWITEMQAGTNYISGNRPMAPTAADITHWLWEAVGTGCKGIVYWLYRAREDRFENQEWGLMNQQGNPSKRSKASKAVSDIIYANDSLFRSLKPKPYDGYILHSYDSMVLSYCDRNSVNPRPADKTLARNSLMVHDACCGAYLLLQDIGLDAGFIPENKIGGALDAGSFIIAPNTYGLKENVVEALYDYAEAGGTLIADGLFAMKTPQGYKSSKRVQALLGKLFSSPVNDWGVSLDGFSFALPGGGKLPAWFLTCNWDDESGVEVLARDGDGAACAIAHNVGKGRAVYIGTQFFQNYFASEGNAENYGDFIKSILPKICRPYTLMNPDKHMRMKLLSGATDVLILLNRGGGRDAIVTSRGAGGGAGASADAEFGDSAAFCDILTGDKFAIGIESAIPMAKGQVRVLVMKK